VDIDELLALACVFEVCPVDLMVSKEATDEPYAVTRETNSRPRACGIGSGGESVRLVPVQQPAEPGEPTFADPAKTMLEALEWMPEQRAHRVGRRFFTGEEPS
jgi:hypothetical protein